MMQMTLQLHPNSWQRFVFAISVVSVTWMSSVNANDFGLESALIDSRSANTLGISKNSGKLATFFEAQKEMLADILRDLGTPLDSLPLDIRQRISRFHTTNFEAFVAYSRGLDAVDQGRYAEAKAFFERVLELDPNFELAQEMRSSMPGVNVPSRLELDQALLSAARSTTTAGKNRVQIDLGLVVAALQQGRTVVFSASEGGTANSTAASAATSNVGSEYTSNPAGSAENLGPRTVVGVAYSLPNGNIQAQIASTGEWTASQITSTDGALASVGTRETFFAGRSAASVCCGGQDQLDDGSTVTWGVWKSSSAASAEVVLEGRRYIAPELGESMQYMVGSATREMPGSGSTRFLPKNGFLANASGAIAVDFVKRDVRLENLGFAIDGFIFSGLNGAASYAAGQGSGFFKGNYTSGSCVGCSGFSATGSAYSGNFVGVNANGLIFSTILQTGNGTSAGTHLFRP